MLTMPQLSLLAAANAGFFAPAVLRAQGAGQLHFDRRRGVLLFHHALHAGQSAAPERRSAIGQAGATRRLTRRRCATGKARDFL
jgi:hypothetical protein